MTSFAVIFIIVIIFFAASSHALFSALNDDLSWLKIAIAGGGFIVSLVLSVAAAWHLYKTTG